MPTVSGLAPPGLDQDATVLNNHANRERVMCVVDVVLHPAIVAIVAAAIDTGLRPAPEGAVDRGIQARLLSELLQRGGPEAVLAAGRRLDVVATEPLMLTLLNSDSPGLLLQKIDRLNRFMHSHHRHVVHHLHAHGVDLEHRSMAGTPPSSAESLFVCGLYLEMLARIGCRELSCAFPDASTGTRDVYRNGTPAGVPVDRTGRWCIEWAAFDPTRPLPGLDEVLLRELPVDLTDLSTARRVEAIVRSDLARSWKLATVAAELAVSPRTLQRRLLAEGRPFTEIVRNARIAAAKELICDPDRTLTDIGYVTGFADSAHFTRTFKAATGSTPSNWRARAAESSNDPS